MSPDRLRVRVVRRLVPDRGRGRYAWRRPGGTPTEVRDDRGLIAGRSSTSPPPPP